MSDDDTDMWDAKTVKIDIIDNELGTTLWLPLNSTFRFRRNDDFLGGQGYIRRYEIEYYTGDMKEVWKCVWLLHQGAHQPTNPIVRKKYPALLVEYAVGFMPVMIPEVNGQYNPNGAYLPRVDRVTMEYFKQGDANEPTDRVYVFLEFGDGSKTGMLEGGTASGPPR